MTHWWTTTPQWLWWDAAWECWIHPRDWKSPYRTPLRFINWEER